SMTEGMVSEWYVPDGGEVKKGEMVYALETEKVNLDVDAEQDGIVKHLVDVGVMLEPGDVVGYIFAPGEEVPNDLAKVQAGGGQMSAAAESQTAGHAEAQTQIGRAASSTPDGRIKSSPAARRLAGELGVDWTLLTGSGPGGRIVEADVAAANVAGADAVAAKSAAPKASPSAKRIAREAGLDLANVQGTGPGGRIIREDIEAAAAAKQKPAAATSAQQPTPTTQPTQPGKLLPITGMRKTIATHMHQSLTEAAQLTMHMEVLMDQAVAMRNQLIAEWQADSIRPTYTDIVVKAVAKALVQHPMMNSQFTADGILQPDDINIGIAVSLPQGLVVPVVRKADKLPLQKLTQESASLAAAARDGSLGLDDYAGGTFTVSALGMYGVDAFTPILNQPQSGILGVNRIYDGVEWDGDVPQKTKKMNLSLTWDHRTLDGAPAAEFLLAVKQQLEAPDKLLD
ncbi:MAG: 2-oxo acid dehydrogenase subunit E2, partial [Pseudomonadales bacterium]